MTSFSTVVILGPLGSLISMIFELTQKSFPTQYLLPFYRFERILHLTNQPLFEADENDSPSGHNNALSPGSALRLQRESRETSTDLDHPGKSLQVDLRATSRDGRHRQTQSEEVVITLRLQSH
jgi:hypothetical protein